MQGVSTRRVECGCVRLALIVVAGCLVLSSAQPARSEDGDQRTFKGICDGSAAVLIDPATLLVAYDEANTLFAFDTAGGRPVARVDVANALELEADDEMDLEGAVRDGDRIWWIGSHGRDGDGEDAPARRTLFATNVPSRDLRDFRVLEGPIDLTDALLASPQVARILDAEVRDRGPKEGGLNIEGLAVHPQGGLLLGFRSPLSDDDGLEGEALLVHVARTGASFEVKGVQQLDLGDRGVRDLVATPTGYVILAGPASSEGAFALYDWDGSGAPRRRASDVLGDLNAEALVRLDEQWLVLSDDGKVKRSDEEAGDGDRKCDKIRKKNSKGEHHQSVYFRAALF